MAEELKQPKDRALFDFWDRLCGITRYAFLLSKAGNSVQKAEGLGNWIDRDEAMAVVGDAQEEINVLRQDCATLIAELEDLRAQLPSQGGEAVEVVGVVCVSRFKNNPAMENVEFHQSADIPPGQHDLMTVAQHQRIMAARVAASSAKPELTVWCGPMPESNGKSNYTALLYRKGESLYDGTVITLDRSEYPDRVRYEADRVRYLIGELDAEPFILDYDPDKHSGYTHPADQVAEGVVVSLEQIKSWVTGLQCGVISQRRVFEEMSYLLEVKSE